MAIFTLGLSSLDGLHSQVAKIATAYIIHPPGKLMMVCETEFPAVILFGVNGKETRVS